MTRPSAAYLRGQRIDPRAITGKETVADLVENAFLAYNAGRLREGCQLFAQRMLAPEVTVGMTLTGAMTPAGLGMSCLIPLMEAGFVDWIISTGANLYHDAHFALGLAMHRGTPNANDVELRDKGVVRIYDVFFDYNVLLSTDQFVREVSARDEFQRPMSSAEYHYLLGGYVREREKALGLTRRSVLAAAHELEVPIYTSSPGDSSIGMNVAEQALAGSKLRFDVSADVNETAAIVLEAKRTGGKSGVLIVGGGSPKNFMLQTEPQIQEVLGIDERGHDYFLQMTDARPDTGGLSGATPAEAVSWGKIDPGPAPRHGRGLWRQLDRPAGAHRLCQGAARRPPAQAAVRPARGDDGAAARGVSRRARVPRPAGRRVAGPHAPGSGGSGDGGAAVTPGYRWYALGLLAVINLLNYIDRNVIYALFESIKHDLALTDAQLGWLGSAYILVFSVAALPFGVISDLRSRRAVIAWGVTVWSAFTFLSGLVRSYWQLFTCRAAVGVGEAAYGPAAASLVADYFPGPRRAMAMGILASGVSLGGVSGLLLGGYLEATYGWRVAFMTVGVPGFICAVLAARLIDPTRPPAKLTVRSFLRDFHIGATSLLRQLWPLVASVAIGALVAYWLDRSYGADSKLDVAAFSAAVGLGLAFNILYWVRRTPADPSEEIPFAAGITQRLRRHHPRRQDRAAHADAGLRLPRGRDDLLRHQRHRGMGADVRRAGAAAHRRRKRGAAGQVGSDRGRVGDAVRRVPGGLAPPLLGDRAGDHRRRWGCCWAVRSRSGCSPSAIPELFQVVFAVAFFCLSWYNGPITAVIFDVVPPRISATVAGAYLLFIHLAGDAIALPLVGMLSDQFGLDRAILLLPLVVILGGGVILGATKTVGRDMARVA